MMLIINICKEKLHYYEFVRPVCDILESFGIRYFVRHYKKLKNGDLKNADKVIICGTSLFDNEFIENIDDFSWLKDFKKPILGICGGMQVIGLIFEGKLKKKTEIGFYLEDFRENFLSLIGEQEVYHLHNYYVDFLKSETSCILPHLKRCSLSEVSEPEISGQFWKNCPLPKGSGLHEISALKDFKAYSNKKISQAVKYKKGEIYGVLFHPEVRQKILIINFCLK